MKKLLWLDDIRNPFIADWLMRYAPQFINGKNEIIWVKNYNEFVKWIEKNELPYMIAFDHDLGEEKSGFDCAKWLVEYCMDKKLSLPLWVVQSANTVGKDNINGLLNNYNKYCN